MDLWGLTVVLLVVRLAYEAGHLLQKGVLGLDESVEQTVGTLASLLSSGEVGKA